MKPTATKTILKPITAQKSIAASRYAIGLDIGTKTGIAVWDKTNKKFISISTEMIHRAMETVLTWHMAHAIEVRVEDARMVRFKTDSFKAQGAGSIKRESKIWEDFLTDHNISFKMVRPNKKITKWDADYFAKVTGYLGRCSVHGRDSALLVFGM